MLLQAIDIYKSYPSGKMRLDILKGLNLEVHKGKILVIIGASGAGKSTLLNLLGTLDKTDEGEILFEGKTLSRLNGKRLTKFRNETLGFIFQFHHLLPEFSALENVLLPALIGRRKGREVIKSAELLLEEVGLIQRKNHKPGQLSCGEAQRIAIVRALINNPALVLADEPTGNLDGQTANEVFSLLQKLTKERNQTLIMVTHNEELAKKGDRILRLVDGKAIPIKS
ncbi:MAG: ABC transporter ATP-binding protein [bacterium]|nr:ABC transporter ATP-binding protein [bacterium]